MLCSLSKLCDSLWNHLNFELESVSLFAFCFCDLVRPSEKWSLQPVLFSMHRNGGACYNSLTVKETILCTLNSTHKICQTFLLALHQCKYAFHDSKRRCFKDLKSLVCISCFPCKITKITKSKQAWMLMYSRSNHCRVCWHRCLSVLNVLRKDLDICKEVSTLLCWFYRYCASLQQTNAAISKLYISERSSYEVKPKCLLKGLWCWLIESVSLIYLFSRLFACLFKCT